MPYVSALCVYCIYHRRTSDICRTIDIWCCTQQSVINEVLCAAYRSVEATRRSSLFDHMFFWRHRHSFLEVRNTCLGVNPRETLIICRHHSSRTSLRLQPSCTLPSSHHLQVFFNFRHPWYQICRLPSTSRHLSAILLTNPPTANLLHRTRLQPLGQVTACSQANEAKTTMSPTTSR